MNSFFLSLQDSKKKIDEREQLWLEKRYRLPENPQILCHPTQHRSLDKFTCEMMSLSILLDYRPEDTKKHCFEVSLFAELFNEMLMRDFGFNIYKALYSMPDVEQANGDKDSKDKREKDEANSDNEEPKEKRSRRDDDNISGEATKATKKDEASSSEKSKGDLDKDSKSKETRGREKDRDKEKSRERRRDNDESDDDTYSLRSDGKRRDHKKLITVDPDLLLSFVYFDQTHCGYIFSTHLEELFYALGLRLSRGDAKKLISRVAPRSLFYR